MWRDPMLILRKRVGGIANAVDAIIDDIDQRKVFAPALVQITGSAVEWADSRRAERPPKTTSATGAFPAIAPIDDDDVLLGKEANEEQIQIIKRLSHSGSVLVQGPPGTGKTHTIANLIGHQLAQGKSILVTAQTAKALRVLRDKVPEVLRPLVRRRAGQRSGCAPSARNVHRLHHRAADDRDQRVARDARDRPAPAAQGTARRIEGAAAGSARSARERVSRDRGRRAALHAVRCGEIREDARRAARVDSRPGEAGDAASRSAPPSLRVCTRWAPRSRRAKSRTRGVRCRTSRSFRPSASSNPCRPIISGSCRRDLSAGTNRWTHTGSSEAIEAIAAALEEEFSEHLRRQAWRPYAIVAGISGGTQREVWEQLIRGIEDAAEANAQCALVRHHRPQLSKTMPAHKQRQIAREIVQHLEAGRGLSMLQMATHSEWRQFVKTASVAAGRALAHRALPCARAGGASRSVPPRDRRCLERAHRQHTSTRCSARWAPSRSSACRALTDEIRRCLDWHAQTWNSLAGSLEDEGLKLDELIAADSARAESARRVSGHRAAGVRSAAAAARHRSRIAASSVRSMRGSSSSPTLADDRRSDGASAKAASARILAAVESHDASAYRAALEYAQRLHHREAAGRGARCVAAPAAKRGAALGGSLAGPHAASRQGPCAGRCRGCVDLSAALRHAGPAGSAGCADPAMRSGSRARPACAP